MQQLPKIVSDANKYVMPAVDDYRAARCLLLNSIFRGLISAHEAFEKLMKALLILEQQVFPKKCHELTTLGELLVRKSTTRYSFVHDEKKFLGRLDGHYGSRYYDGDPKKRSRDMSISELHPVDSLFVRLYESYMDFLPEESRCRSYLMTFLFSNMLKEYTNWSELLLHDNRALKKRITDWEARFADFYKDM